MVTSCAKVVVNRTGAPACQDQIAGGHAGVGVVNLGGASLSAPSLVTADFKEFFRLARAVRFTIPTGQGGVVHLFVFLGIYGVGGGL